MAPTSPRAREAPRPVHAETGRAARTELPTEGSDHGVRAKGSTETDSQGIDHGVPSKAPTTACAQKIPRRVVDARTMACSLRKKPLHSRLPGEPASIASLIKARGPDYMYGRQRRYTDERGRMRRATRKLPADATERRRGPPLLAARK